MAITGRRKLSGPENLVLRCTSKLNIIYPSHSMTLSLLTFWGSPSTIHRSSHMNTKTTRVGQAGYPAENDSSPRHPTAFPTATKNRLGILLDLRKCSPLTWMSTAQHLSEHVTIQDKATLNHHEYSFPSPLSRSSCQ